MRSVRLGEAYHTERSVAAREGIRSYPCACEKCHGFRTQTVEVVERHHRKFGRDRNLPHPLLGVEMRNAEPLGDPVAEEDVLHVREEFFDAEDDDNFEDAPLNAEVNLEQMAENFFSRANEIHQLFTEDEDEVLDFDDLSSEEEEPDRSDVLEQLLHEAAEPLFQGSRSSRLQFSIILMSLCTLYSISHHCLDEILTFLKHDVLPEDNKCPTNSYEMKTLLMKLGLSHEVIHCCDCGRTLYWKDKSNLTSCPQCHKSRYIDGSETVPVRVLRFFSLIKRLRRMYKCPELSKHMRWHSSNHSEDGKMRSVVDSEQWRFIDNTYPSFSRHCRNVRMGLSLDGVNPHSFQSSKHSIWPVLIVLYNLPPYLVTKQFFICLTMIIPGPKSPTEDTIDVFLQPLVHELKKLWVGVPAVDMGEPPDGNRHFNLRGILMWTIHDFPAYTLISGQAGKGYAGCPVCGDGTNAEHSREAGKTVFLRNRRWLPQNHRWRAARAAFDGHFNHDPPPPRQSGQTIISRGAWRESYLQCGGRKNGDHDLVKHSGVKRVSILFQLPYWHELPVRHLLDPMHCEKNLCENLIRTLLGETDGVKSREDLRTRGIRCHLHLQPNPDGVTFFMPDAPYVLTGAEREEFFQTLKDIKFPTNYVGSLKQRLQDGKLSGLKTHDFHILLEQVLPLCLRNIGNPLVVGAIMRVSRIFRKICSKVVDSHSKVQMMQDVAESICALEKELPPSVFVVMMHLPIHLVEELFLCGPVHTRWMYPFERYMKVLKGFVKNKAKPEGSMANGYLREESIGFLTEYLSNYTPTTKRAWDENEDSTLNDEILEGAERDRRMSLHFQKLIHGFVLDNAEHMQVYRRRYAAAVTERNVRRDVYQRQQRRRGRRHSFAYPQNLCTLPNFSSWVLQEVTREEQSGVIVPAEVVDTARGPLETATSYKSMYAFGNHFRVRSSEQSMKTCDSGVAATFRQVCRNGISDANQIEADVEYVGHIEEILELNYRRHCVVVLVCDFVKANYRGQNATIKKDKWGFTLANYERRPGIVCRDSFAFPKHCDQVFYCDAAEAPGWKIVLRKEVRGRRVLPSNEDDVDAELFNMGEDQEFQGLRPQTEVGEGPAATVRTGHDVVRQERLVPGRAAGVQGRGRNERQNQATHGGGSGVPSSTAATSGRPPQARRHRRARPVHAVAEELLFNFPRHEHAVDEHLLQVQNLRSGINNREDDGTEEHMTEMRRTRQRTDRTEDVGAQQWLSEDCENTMTSSSGTSLSTSE